MITRKANNMNDEEKLIGVPLDAASKAALEARAAANGRSMAREANIIIRRELAASAPTRG